jgi:uncharacterized protein YdaU (DUF1376 family)
MPVYVGDWDADTRDLSCEEDGAYWRLVRHYWRRGAPPNDDDVLATIVGVTPRVWRRMRPKLAVFFKIGRGRQGRWVHARVEHVLRTSKERKRLNTERARAAAKARYTKEKAASSKACSTAQAVPDDCPSSKMKPPPKGEGLHLQQQKTRDPEVVAGFERLLGLRSRTAFQGRSRPPASAISAGGLAEVDVAAPCDDSAVSAR